MPTPESPGFVRRGLDHVGDRMGLRGAVVPHGPKRTEAAHDTGTHVVVEFPLDGIEIGRMDQAKVHRVTDLQKFADRPCLRDDERVS